MQTTLNTLTATEMAALVARRDVSCTEIATACLARIAAREPVVRAWASLDPELVLQQARALDTGPLRGPLHGVPVGVKDIIDTYDMPTEMGSPIYRGHQPVADAACVAQARAAGAIILGKTVTCEFAGVTAGPTTHPLNPAHTPGGSSSGSAAAVADNMVPLAYGTQTGGSVQRPSSFCGIVGYKPSFGLINTAGVKPAAVTLDIVGLMARTVEDVELFARALTNSAPIRWLPAGQPLRVGLCRTYLWETAQSETKAALEDAARRLEGCGCEIREVSLPDAFESLATAREVVNDYERARGMAHEWANHRSEVSEGLAKSIRNGLTIPLDRFLETLDFVDRCRAALADVFDGIDVLLAPAVPGEAPRGLEWTGDHRFQSLWTLLRTPTMTLPTHTGPTGLPVGIQIVAPPRHDVFLIKAAQLILERLGRNVNVTHDGQIGVRLKS